MTSDAAHPEPTADAVADEPTVTVPLAAGVVGALITVAALVVFVVVLVLLSWPWWIAIPLALLVGALGVWMLIRSSFVRTIDGLGLTDANRSDNARLDNLVEGLALSIGAVEPDVYILEDSGLNAIAIRQGEQRAIAVTSSLIAQVDRVALEGVVAELLVRLRGGEAETATIASGLLGPLVDGPFAPLLRGIGSKLLGGLAVEDQAIQADLAAVAVTRYPPGLGTALETIAQHGARPKVATIRNDHLWLVPPLQDDAVVPTSPLAWRIDTLLEI